MKKIFPIFASISVLIIALSVAYYLVIFIPGKEEVRQELKEEELQLKETEQQEEKSETEIYSDCDAEARRGAIKLLKSKIEIAEKSNLTHMQDYKIWKEASEKGLFLKDDYNEYYNACIRRYGIKY